LQKCGFYAFYMFAGINILLAIFVYFFIPETKGVMLEEMDAMFGGANHVNEGGNLMGIDDAHHANPEKDVLSPEKTQVERVQEVRQ
jgi:hypothetical protein